MSIRILFIACFMLSFGCAKDPSKDAPKAQVGQTKTTEATPKAKAPTPAPAPKAKTANAAVALEGTVGFTGSKVTGSHDGVFKDWSGTMTVGAAIESSSLSFEVKVASVVSDPENRKPWSGKLDTHLKSDDFFFAEKHPTATFKSTAIKASADGKGTHTVTGDLNLRGTTRAVTFPATIKLDGKAVTAKAEFTINRSDWGIVYKGKANDLIRDGVVMKIDIKGSRI